MTKRATALRNRRVLFICCSPEGTQGSISLLPG
jgi:hypothetical protein